MDLNKLLNISTYAGKIMLENGAETYRVEETIVRICLAFGADIAESFVIPAKKSPAIVSRIAFVIRIPGTRIIIDPIIVLSRLEHILIFIAATANNAHNAPPRQLIKKLFSSNFSHMFSMSFKNAPIINAVQKSFIFPPNRREKHPAEIPEEI